MRTAAPPHSQPALPADCAAGPMPYGKRRQGAHLELRLGDLAAAVQVERGEGVPDGFEQFVFQAPHGRGRAAPTDQVSPIGNSAPLPPAGSPQTTLPAARSPDRSRPRPQRTRPSGPAPPSHQPVPGIPSVHYRDVNKNVKSLWWVSTPTRALFKARMCPQRNFHHPEEHSRLQNTQHSASAVSAGVPQLFKEP